MHLAVQCTSSSPKVDGDSTAGSYLENLEHCFVFDHLLMQGLRHHVDEVEQHMHIVQNIRGISAMRLP